MPTLPLRAAAYTRTSILRRFLDVLSQADPGQVDAPFAEQRLALKGGDVRAFLQSLRVLGLIDAYGQTTDRARRLRGVSQRAEAMREALREAYPELWDRWQERGGMPRQAVEDFFKVEYGLSTSTAAPAAKLLSDLMREYATAPFCAAAGVTPEAATPSRQLPEPDGAGRAVAGGVEATGSGRPAGPPDVRTAALEAIKSSLQIHIDAEWDRDRITLVFDRMERLVDRILASP